MDFDKAIPLFTSGKELANFLLMGGIVLEAWELIPKDFTNNANTFVVKEDGNVVYVVFPSFLEDFAVRDGRYGECPVQNENRVFSDCLKDDDGGPALVHPGAFNRFEFVLLHSNFKAQMQSIIDGKREQNIIFVGHSMGGAVATLATIWMLEKRVKHISPFCITFGCPLVGDTRLGQAIGREDWLGKFCHVVSQYDVIPRMLLAPVESIAEYVDAILPYWVNIMGNDSPFIQDACRTILRNVLQYTSLEESSLESPYRPFGTYMFCSRNGAACIEDNKAILNMLHLTMQSNERNSFDARACVSEHTHYGNMLKHIIGDLVNTRRIARTVLSSSFEVQILLILEAIGVGDEYKEHAWMALRKAGEVENMYDTNTRELNANLSKNQVTMAHLEWYKTRCQSDGPGYYDLFKQQDRRDQKANHFRITLEVFWDQIIEMVKRHELPRDFQSQNKWINAGTAYRKLVEPLDIAHYYHIKKGSGSYLSLRPSRHIVLEKWLKEKEKTRSGRNKKPRTKFASLTEDSLFWAYLEESCKDLKSLQGEQDPVQCARLKESLEEFEAYVWKMIEDRNISAEIFLQESSFMKWWQQYSNAQFQSPQWKSRSSLLDFMRREGWRNI